VLTVACHVFSACHLFVLFHILALLFVNVFLSLHGPCFFRYSLFLLFLLLFWVCFFGGCVLGCFLFYYFYFGGYGVAVFCPSFFSGLYMWRHPLSPPPFLRKKPVKRKKRTVERGECVVLWWLYRGRVYYYWTLLYLEALSRRGCSVDLLFSPWLFLEEKKAKSYSDE